MRNSTAKLDNGWEISFEKCLIATGGQPKNLKVFQSSSNRLKSKVTLYRGVSCSIDVFFLLLLLLQHVECRIGSQKEGESESNLHIRNHRSVCDVKEKKKKKKNEMKIFS